MNAQSDQNLVTLWLSVEPLQFKEIEIMQKLREI